ncbi:hypothetical protein AVEN_98999-1 [Araneus ventricosus]|uniref:Uncharacterized protein n=1 Tax=Araneus ventricosus TaxID=182803 RepID=A0A4Y2G443_ARAVE|nr:hypothetical protein AVEN_98999-1 [Araneus ventricosus]
MNFEGRWPFKSNGVSWGAVHNLSKAKGKFLNVGDHYLKTLKKKNKNFDAEVAPVDSRYDYMLSLISLASGLSKDDLSEENAQQKKVDLANGFFTDTKLRRLLFLSADSITGASSRSNPNAVVLHVEELFELRGLCSLFVKEISNEPLPQNVINMNVFFYLLNASPNFVFGTLYQTLKFAFLPRLRKVWCDTTDFSYVLPTAYENLLYTLDATADAFKVSHLGITRGLTLRQSSVALAEATAAADEMPSQETTKEAENLINIWKDQIEQVRCRFNNVFSHFKVGLRVERRHHLKSVCLQDVVLVDQTDENRLELSLVAAHRKLLPAQGVGATWAEDRAGVLEMPQGFFRLSGLPVQPGTKQTDSAETPGVKSRTPNTKVSTQQGIQYPNIPSAVRPVRHNESFPIPLAPKTYILQPETDFENFEPQPGPSTSTDDDEEYPADLVHRQLQLVTELQLNDLVRDLELPKSKSQLLGSRLQQWNLLEKGVKNLFL